MNWYQIDSKDSFRKLSTSEIGLTDKQVRERLLQYGPNKLAEEEKIRRFRILLHQFTSPLIYILLIAAIVTFFLKEYTIIINVVKRIILDRTNPNGNGFGSGCVNSSNS